MAGRDQEAGEEQGRVEEEEEVVVWGEGKQRWQQQWEAWEAAGMAEGAAEGAAWEAAWEAAGLAAGCTGKVGGRVDGEREGRGLVQTHVAPGMLRSAHVKAAAATSLALHAQRIHGDVHSHALLQLLLSRRGVGRLRARGRGRRGVWAGGRRPRRPACGTNEARQQLVGSSGVRCCSQRTHDGHIICNPPRLLTAAVVAGAETAAV